MYIAISIQCAAHTVCTLCVLLYTPPKFPEFLGGSADLPSHLSASLRRRLLFLSFRLAIAGPPSLHIPPYFGKRLINCVLLVKRHSINHEKAPTSYLCRTMMLMYVYGFIK